MSAPSDTGPFPLRHIAEIEPRPKDARWLIDSLWAAQGVGIVGGEPKTFKTWLATELALAVAGGGLALGRFAAREQGPAVIFAAEDDAPDMRERFDAVAQARKVDLRRLPLHLLDLAVLRLDDPRQIERLRQTVQKARARLLVLDPFVRLANVDENSAQEVSAVLGSLRAIQRELKVAVLVVHHMRKSPSARPGQQLRGSGDFAAWCDSGLYLVHRGRDLLLCAEHRRAPAPEPLRLRLSLDGSPHLVAEDLAQAAASMAPDDLDRLEAALLETLRPGARAHSANELRDALRIRKARLLEVLHRLEERGLVARGPAGWTLHRPPPPAVTQPQQQPLPFALPGSSKGPHS
jgi:hypothetical protein